MMTRTLLARCAPLAIAASAAFPFAAATAQDTVTAEPAIVLPDPAPAPASSPTIALPETVAEPVAEPAPVTAAQPGAEPAAAVAAPLLRSAPRAVTAARSAPDTAVAAAAAQPAAPVAASPVPAARASTTVPAGQSAPVAYQPAAVSSAGTGTGEIALAALLAALGVGTVGAVAYAASRRRRASALARALERDRKPALGEPGEPMRAAAPVAARSAAPALTIPTMAAATTAPVLGAASRGRTASRAHGDPVVLPDQLPETFEERDALLKKLVAAAPDRANPFTSPRARARRAKLIIQSLARDFTSRKPRIDLSEYTNRWPALRGWQPAAA